jgi:RimJ/RimL family protein N-acetyltransferase
MPKTTLKKMQTTRDWLGLRAVRTKPEQRKFTTLLMLSYMQSSHHAITMYGVYLDDTAIGYVMLIQADDPSQWIIERLTIDRDHQRQGYGYDVVDQLVDKVYELEDSEMVVARYDKDNTAARDLFAKLKFEERDKPTRGRKIAVLKFEFEDVDEDDEPDDDIDVSTSASDEPDNTDA